MSSAAGRLLYSGCRISSLGIDHEIGTKARGVGQLAIVDVDCADEEAHGLRQFDGQGTKSARARDSDPFAGPCLGLLNPLVGRNPSADQRRGFRRRKTRGHMGNVIWIADDVFSKTAVLGVAAELSVSAYRLPAS